MLKTQKKILKIVLGVIVTIIITIILLLVAIQIPYVQNFAKDKAVVYLQDKLKTKVEIGYLDIDFPKKIVLNDVYFEDQSSDTLLHGKRIAVDISLFKILDNTIEINSVDLQNITSKITKNKDSVFNFDYIIKAFETPKDPNDDSPPMVFSIKKIHLEKINFTFDDVISKNDFNLKLNSFDTEIQKFDLENNDFEIDEIKSDHLFVKLNQGINEATDKVVDKVKEETVAKPLQLKIKTIALSNSGVDYIDESSHLNSKVSFKDLLVEFNKIDITNQKIVLENFELNDTKAHITFDKYQKEKKSTANSSNSSTNWEVQTKKVQLSNTNLKFDDNNSKPVSNGIDYMHLDFTNLNLNATNLMYSVNASKGVITSLNFKEKSGLVLKELRTDFMYASTTSSLKNLYIETPQTQIKDEIILTYPSIESVTNLKNPSEIAVFASIDNSKISFKDILLFAPQLANQKAFQSNPNAIVYLNTRLKGSLNKLEIPNFKLKGFNSTDVSFHGSINGLLNFETAIFKLQNIDAKSGAKDVYALAPNNSIPKDIAIPESFHIKGDFNGSMSQFVTKLYVKSSFGNAIANMSLDQSRKNQEKYQLDAKLDQFNVGKLIKNSSIGNISGTAFIKGTSFDPKSANATIQTNVSNAYFNKYNYTDLSIDGVIENGNYTVQTNSNDPNLMLKANASGDFNGQYPSLKLNLNLDIADLNKLNLHAGPLKLKGDVVANFESLDIDNLNGSLEATNFLVALETEQFPLDTITVKAFSSAEIDSLLLKSQFANAKLSGNYKLSTIASSLRNSINNYFNTGSSIPIKNNSEQRVDFEIVIKDEPILMKLDPKLIEISRITLNGKYNTVNDSIILNGSIPRLTYNNLIITNATVAVKKVDENLNYNLNVANLKGLEFQIPQTQISGKIGNNNLNYLLEVKDLKNTNRFSIDGILANKNGVFENHVNSDNLLLNYQNWNVDPNNLIRITENDIYINDFKITNTNSQFSIQSESKKTNAPIAIQFKDFDLKTVTSIAESNFEIGGSLNGNTTVSNVTSNPVFIADLDIENFAIKNDTVGNIKLNVDNKTANIYAAHLQLSGNGNDLDLKGNYKIGSGNLDFNLLVNRLQMKSLQAFTMQNLKESEGYLNGKLAITGLATNPEIVGKLKFNQVGFNVVPLNSRFNLINDEVVFRKNEIVFQNFKLKDENDNDLKINGKLISTDFTNPGFDLNVIADNFRAVNSEAKDNELFYGELFLDNNIFIKGTLDNPIVDGKVKINSDTKFTIVLPQDDPSIESRQGVVQFVDQDQPVLVEVKDPMKKIAQTDILGINASLNIEVDKKAEISIVIDEANGDFLKLQGEAQLTGGIDPSGKTTLTGKYEFTGGSYEMNFNLIKRKFDIKPGSYILWTGEPTSANVDVVAVYRSDVAPIDLVDDQLVGLTPDERNTYKQRIPFETELKMKGDLMQPEISFDIILPEGNNNVSTDIINTTQAKLELIRQQPEVLNKQVFAILLLNRFIGENPFQSESGGISAAYLARQSASRILTEQLNNLTEGLIKGFELDFDLQATEDYTSGQKQNRTDLNIGLSKQLLNDRLKVTIGSNFGLEGGEQQNEQSNNIAGDVSADYLLTKDGRYKIKAYRKNDYQVALQGQVIETGVAFIITMNYDKFKELFQKSKTEDSKKKKNKKEK